MDVRYKPHHAGNTPEERIHNRLKNSGGDHPPSGGSVQVGNSPNRTITNLHPYGSRNHDGAPKNAPMPYRDGGE
jgi:hypothetical protein